VAGAEGTVTPGGEAAGEPGPAFPVWALALVVVLIAALAAFLVMRKK
jgi:lipopolysaccharide export LptBFGC system permease protein LptF